MKKDTCLYRVILSAEAFHATDKTIRITAGIAIAENCGKIHLRVSPIDQGYEPFLASCAAIENHSAIVDGKLTDTPFEDAIKYNRATAAMVQRYRVTYCIGNLE